MVEIDKDGLHPSELSRCCVARVKVVVYGSPGLDTDYICTKCEELCARYTKTGGANDPWPPDTLLAALHITRDEWDDMQASTLPRDLAVAVMFQKTARRLMNSVLGVMLS